MHATIILNDFVEDIISLQITWPLTCRTRAWVLATTKTMATFDILDQARPLCKVKPLRALFRHAVVPQPHWLLVPSYTACGA